LVQSIERFAGAVIIVTHDEMILKRVAKKLLVFQHGNVELFHGGYDDFLRRIGWEDKADLKVKPEQPKASSKSKKELRQLRGQILNEKSKILKPLKRKIEILEETICKLEEEVETVTFELQNANESRDADQIAKLSKRLHDLNKRISSDFTELEKVVRLYDEKNSYFEELLK